DDAGAHPWPRSLRHRARSLCRLRAVAGNRSRRSDPLARHTARGRTAGEGGRHGAGAGHAARLGRARPSRGVLPLRTLVFLCTGALFACAGVVAGAIGAHALEKGLGAEQYAIFETGVRYHLVHALALFAVAWASTVWPGRATLASGGLFIAGIVFFSGSLYLL